jgi:peptide/nickel transport system substrate-binding protein
VTERSSGRWSVLRLFALILSLALFTAACGGGGGDDGGDATGQTTGEGEGDETPVPGGEVRVGLEAESQGWQPCRNSFSTPGDMVMFAIHDRLMQTDDDGNIKPFLAESLTSNDALTEWTLKLRPNVKFHDGTPLNAAAIKDNFDTGIKAPTSVCAGAAKPINEVQVVDELTVKYVLASPYAPFPDLLANSNIGMPYSPAAAKAKGDQYPSSPVGTGAFKFVSWQRDNQLIVEKNPDYWIKGQPHLDRVIFRPIPDEDARLAALQSGEVDVMHSLRQSIVKAARELPEGQFTSYEFIGNNSGGSIFNTTVAPVDDKRVRKALAFAVNQRELIAVLGGEGISPEATQFWSKDSPWYSERVAKEWPQNKPEEAKKLVAAYVNDPARSDRKPVGSPIEVTFNCPPDPSLIEVAQAYQRQAQAVGIQMKLQQFEQSVHIQNAVGKPPYTSADYMINCWRLGGQQDPDTTLFNQYGPVEGNAANVTNFTSPKLQELLKRGRETKDTDERKKIYEEISLLFNDEVPHLWTGNTATTIGAKTNVKNLTNWKFPDGKTVGNGAELSLIRFREVWVQK